MTYVSWESLIEYEPRLIRLAERAAFGGDARDFENVKADLRHMVGFDAESPDLRTCDAYEVAYAEILRRFEAAGGRF
jgi:hypothetical protein